MWMAPYSDLAHHKKSFLEIFYVFLCDNPSEQKAIFDFNWTITTKNPQFLPYLHEVWSH